LEKKENRNQRTKRAETNKAETSSPSAQCRGPQTDGGDRSRK
jgi:hypothetical protein